MNYEALANGFEDEVALAKGVWKSVFGKMTPTYVNREERNRMIDALEV